MIDFRYHLVSIVAVFLALAIGIVLGSTALRDPLTAQLQSTTSSLRDDNEKLRDQTRQYQQQVMGDNALVSTFAPQLVAGRLTGERVVLVLAPGASQGTANTLSDLVAKAGGSITGQVLVQAAYLDPTKEALIDQLTDQLRPSRLQLPDGSAYDRAAAEVADAVITREADRAGQEYPAGDAVLSGFQEAGFLSLSGKPGARATLALVIAPQQPFADKNAAASNKALAALALALDTRGRGAVVAGPLPSAGAGGLVKALRDDPTAAKVSTVDNADTPSGQVVTVFALAGEGAGKAGDFGVGPGVDAVLPSPVPAATGHG